MSRRPSPERLSDARRAATLARLVSAGELPERAEAALTAWEAAQDGPRKLDDWDRAYREITARDTTPRSGHSLTARK